MHRLRIHRFIALIREILRRSEKSVMRRKLRKRTGQLVHWFAERVNTCLIHFWKTLHTLATCSCSSDSDGTCLNKRQSISINNRKESRRATYLLQHLLIKKIYIRTTSAIIMWVAFTEKKKKLLERHKKSIESITIGQMENAGRINLWPTIYKQCWHQKISC